MSTETKITEDRYTHLRTVLGDELFEKVRKSRILVVGAGGIGCELLKNLVLSGFEDIEIIDLDSIDVSNLNRQFLFRQHHVGKSKSQVARESALRFNPNCKIVSRHGNIKHPDYGLAFFKSFTLVLNALDNVDARRHVNRMCLSADIPFVDGGTAGYEGQVKAVKKNVTECYECNPVPQPKSFAVCTIRSNPSKMIHCVVWGKLLFERLFGVADDDNAISNFEQIKQITEPDKFAEAVFTKVFYEDIKELKSIKNKSVFQQGEPVEIQMKERPNVNIDNVDNVLRDQKIWSKEENIHVFLKSAEKLYEKTKDGSTLSFDKDDDLSLDLVTAASNLRAINFNIPTTSRFEVKALAGNIVPAIATTNAIIAGMLVVEALKILNNRIDLCKLTYCRSRPALINKKPSLLYPIPISKPNPDCYICSSHFVTIKLNCNLVTLKFFVEEILKKGLSLQEPSVAVDINIVYECGDNLMEEEKKHYNNQLKKFLKDLKIVHNSSLIVEDFSQDINWKITILHDETLEVEEYAIAGKPDKLPQPVQKEPTTVEETKSTSKEEDDDDAIEIVEPKKGTKRKREDEEDGSTKKKYKLDEVEVIEID